METIYTKAEEHSLVKGTLLATLATLGKEYRVTLQFWPTQYITSSTDNPYGLTSLLHLTTTEQSTSNVTELLQHGVTTPAIYIEEARGLHIGSSFGKNINHRHAKCTVHFGLNIRGFCRKYSLV